MRGAMLPLSQYAFMAPCVLKAQGQLSLLHFERLVRECVVRMVSRVWIGFLWLSIRITGRLL
jgi:hypothetical protein